MAAALLGGALVMLSGGGSAPALSGDALRASVASSYGKLPLRFEANRGQTDDRVDFLSRGAGYSLFLTPSESVLALTKTAPGHRGRPGATSSAVLRMRLAGGDPHAAVSSARPLPGATNYLRGKDPSKWQTGVRGYGEVRYAGVYPGVDLVYHGKQGKLEYDFRVAPGADPDRIAMRFSGADKISVDAGGNLVLKTAGGTIRHDKPLVYQTIGGTRRLVPARFVLSEGDRVAFEIGAYDRTQPLVIDPIVVYSTYLGGLSIEEGHDIAADATGNAYVVGLTASPNFPTQDPLQATQRGADAFVTKISASGSALVYSTYLGGVGFDNATAVVVGADGSAYITGDTRSGDFPVTPGAMQPARAGTNSDAFVTKISPSGSALSYSTYLGGTGFDSANGIAVDGSGSAYVTGTTGSVDFPLQGPIQATRSGGSDAFVSKLTPGGTAVEYSTYLGGGAGEFGAGIDIDATGSAYVVGQTTSGDPAPFPTTAGAFDTTCGDDGVCNAKTDGYVSKLNPDGSALDYSTFLGAGDGFDTSVDVAVGSGPDAGKAYVLTTSELGSFPLTEFSFDSPGNVFVSKFDVTGSAVDYSIRIGGSGGGAIAVDSTGSAIVTGGTDPPAPALRPVNDRLSNDDTPERGFASKISPSGRKLTWSTDLGGPGLGVAVDAARTAYLTGTTVVIDFPTQNPFQAHNSVETRFNERETYVMKLDPDVPGAPYVSTVSPKTSDIAGGRAVKLTGDGFDNASGVSFGEVPATRFDVISDGEISAIAPSQTAEGAMPIVVTRNGLSSPPNPATRIIYMDGQWSRTSPDTVERGINGGQPNLVLLKTGKVLLAGGGTRVCQLYDPKTGTWSDTGSTNLVHNSISATLLQSGKVLITGDSAEPAEIYDPASGAWTVTQGVPPSSSAVTLLFTGKVLLASGTGMLLYDPVADSSAPTAQQPATGGSTVGLKSGKILFFGGGSEELYDPATDSFSPTGAMVLGHSGGTATLLQSGKVLVAGGFKQKAAELYDPVSGTWALTRPLELPLALSAAVLLPNGKVLITGGGVFLSSLDSAVLYDPALGATGGFKPAGVMSTRMLTPRALLLSSDPFGFAADPAVCGTRCGKVLVGASETNAAELYTPRAVPVPPPVVVEAPPPPVDPGPAPAGDGGSAPVGDAPPVIAPLPAPAPAPVAAKPRLNRLSVSARNVTRGRGVVLRFRLDRRVAVTISIRRSTGRGRFTSVLRRLKLTGRAGANAATIRASALSRVGLYKLTVKPAGGVAASINVRVLRAAGARSGS